MYVIFKKQNQTQQQKKAFLIYAPEESMESGNLEMPEGPAHLNSSFDLQEICFVSAAFFNQLSCC